MRPCLTGVCSCLIGERSCLNWRAPVVDLRNVKSAVDPPLVSNGLVGVFRVHRDWTKPPMELDGEMAHLWQDKRLKKTPSHNVWSCHTITCGEKYHKQIQHSQGRWHINAVESAIIRTSACLVMATQDCIWVPICRHATCTQGVNDGAALGPRVDRGLAPFFHNWRGAPHDTGSHVPSSASTRRILSPQCPS